ncbi:MAG TPA: hypothetical protein VEC13_02605, partial [Candidatus Paceibacterota bacterium]|nr:hypothetical protein [Candidatus Paceibacterota bacterium]
MKHKKTFSILLAGAYMLVFSNCIFAVDIFKDIQGTYTTLAPLPDASGNMQNTIKIDNKGEGNNVNLE